MAKSNTNTEYTPPATEEIPSDAPLLVRAGLKLPKEFHSFIQEVGRNVKGEYLRKGDIFLIALDLTTIEKNTISAKGKGVSWLFDTYPSAQQGKYAHWDKLSVAVSGYVTDSELKAKLKKTEGKK